MTENPYRLSNVTFEERSSRSTKWLFRAGIVSIIAAFVCFLVMLVGMLRTYNSVARFGSTPKPSDLAQGINVASILSIAIVPLLILGCMLILAGLLIRQAASDQ